MNLAKPTKEVEKLTAKKFFTHPAGVIISSLFATFLWGSAFPFIKISYGLLKIESHEIGEQMLFAGYRFLLAGLLVLIFFMLMNQSMKLKKATIGPLLKIGIFQTFLQYVFFYIGLSLSTGIQGSIIAGTTSFFQMILAHFMYRDDKINNRKLFGLFIGFAGVIIVNLTDGEFILNFGLGEFLLILAMLSGGFGNILAKEGAKDMPVGYLTSYQMIFGSLGLLIIGVFQEGIFPFEFNLLAILVLLYLAFLSAAGFILWNNVMKYNYVGKVSIYLFFVPVFGVFLSSLLLGEELHAFILAGLALVASGIIIVNGSSRSKAQQNSNKNS